MNLKGNEKVIGVVIGVILSVLASVAGLQSEAIKVGICGASSVEAPAATTVPAETK